MTFLQCLVKGTVVFVACFSFHLGRWDFYVTANNLLMDKSFEKQVSAVMK